MDSPFSIISNFFTDGVFGNLIRFLFDRIFGSHFTTNINISNLISLKNGSFKDLQLDPAKVNKKHFKNSSIKLFSGSIGTLSIKFPSFHALLTESIEVSIDKVDLLFYIGDVDYSTAENDISQPSRKEGSTEEDSLDAELQNLDKNLDVYKKIINKILLNMQLKVQNLCIRFVNGKPYKEVRLPIAPCIMLKIGEIDFKRDLSHADSSSNSNVDESGMIFTKHHKYDISISSITAHMMSNYELKTNEYQGESSTNAVFPFTYPNEFHPSTFFVCACKKRSESSRSTTGREIEPINIRINFSNDKSKTIDVNVPHIEIMLDFLKIKYISKYLDKAMELKKFSDYKKGLALSSKPIKKVRKESFDINTETIRNAKSRRESEILTSIPTSNTGKKIKIAGYLIDTAYFQPNKESSSIGNETVVESIKESDKKIEGANELDSDSISPENLLDTKNMRIKLELSSFHAYLLKTCSAFMETEFKRYWLFGSKPQSERPTFNKRIPINYFQIRLKRLEFTHDSKENNSEIQFNSLSIYDVCRIENPAKLKMNQTYKSSAQNSAFNSSKMMSFRSDHGAWNKSDVFQSFKKGPGSEYNEGNLIVGNSMDSSDVFELAQSQITKEFLGIRELSKQLVDWELDSKNHHFCINVLVKLSKAETSESSSNKKSSQNAKVSEDAIIHTPFNGGPVNPENFHPDKKILFRFQNKNGKKTIMIELTQIYINFYPSLVNDFNALLHDASAGYAITENWYWDQNQGLITKWEEEVIDANLKSMVKQNSDEKKVMQVIQDYEATQQTNLDFVFTVQLIKVVLNMENVNRDTTTCFCGFTSLFTEKPTHSNPLFTKEFIILDIESIGIKALKSINSGSEDNVRNLALRSSTILQSINIYVPTDLVHDGQILLTCLLSLKSSIIKEKEKEEKRVIPTILVKVYEDNEFHETLPTKISRENSDCKDDNKGDSPFKMNRQSLNISDSEYTETADLYENFQKHMNKNFLPDMKYLNSLKAEANTSITLTLPLIEVFVSKNHLKLVNNFLKNLKARIKDVDAKMQEIINEEKKLFSSMILKAPIIKKQTSKTFQIYLDQLCIYSYLDEIVESKYKRFITESKKKGNLTEFINSSLQLDASVRLDESMLNQSVVAQGVTNAIKMHFPNNEFIEAAKGNLSVLIRQIESIFYLNPKYGLSLAHSEVYDLTIIDKSQELVLFGAFDKSKDIDKKECIEEDIESYFAIVYKQSRNNYAEKNLRDIKSFTEDDIWKTSIPDHLNFFESSFKIFEFKKSNILSFGMFAFTTRDATSMDINLRISELNFRSDFTLECIDLIKNLLSAFEENKQSDELNSPSLSLKRNPSLKRNNPMLIRIALENIMVDINPYFTYTYYSMNIDKTVDSSKNNNLYYSGMRSIIAIESIELRLSKHETDFKFDTFKISELDLLMKNNKNVSSEDGLILRSFKQDGNLFDNNYSELAEKFKFVYQVLKLSGFYIENQPNNDKVITLEKIVSNIFCDTLSSIENQVHLILFLIAKKLPQKSNPAQQNKKSILKNKPQNVRFEDDKIKGDENIILDIKYDHFEKLKIDIDDDDCLVIDDDDDFEDFEKESPSKIKKDNKSDEPVKIEDEKFDGFKEIEFDHTIKHFSSDIGPIHSCISFFREKCMHNFNFNSQESEKKSIIQVLEIEIKVFSGSIFENKDQKDMYEEENQIPEEISESISLKISEIVLHHTAFKPNLSYETNCDYRISSSIKNIEIVDLNSKGKQNLLFSKLEETDALSISGRNVYKQLKESKITADHMVNFIIESYERKPFKKRDLRIFLGIHPIELNIGKPHYNFFRDFANKMQQKRLKLQDLVQHKEPQLLDSKSKIKIPESPYFIPIFVIAPLELKMKVNLDISVISFDLFKDCTLVFDTFAARGIDHIPQLRVQIIEYYLKLLKKQTGKFVTDLPLLRNVKNLSKATLNVFYSPYSQYVDGGNITLGLKDGIVGFFGSLANESTNLFTFFTGTVENIASEIRGINSRR